MKRSLIAMSMVAAVLLITPLARAQGDGGGKQIIRAVDQCWKDNCSTTGRSVSWCLACCILHCDGMGGATACQDACTKYRPRTTDEFNVIVGAMLTSTIGSDEPSQKGMFEFVTGDEIRGPTATLTQAVSLCYVYRHARWAVATLAVALASDRLISARMDQDTRQALQDLIYAAAGGEGRDDPRLRNMGVVAIGEAGLTYSPQGLFALANAYFTDASAEVRRRALCTLQGID